MKKIKIIVLLLIGFIFLNCTKEKFPIAYKSGFSTNSIFDTIKIAVVGNSTVADCGAIGACDSLWHKKYGIRLSNIIGQPVIVYQINEIGGRTIGSIDPRKITGRPWNYTNYEYNFGLVDSVLKVKPNIVIIAAQSNEVANGMPLDTIFACYKSCIDTLKARGIAFILTDGYARQRSFSSVFGVNRFTYHDSTVKFNNWLYSNYNYNTARIYSKLYDSIFGQRPKPEMLRSDSLHSSDLGQTQFLDGLMESPITVGIISNFNPVVTNFSFLKVNNNLQLKANFKGQYIIISGSNNYNTFTEIKMLNVFSSTNQIIDEKLPNSNYTWYKIEFFNKKRKYTVTKRIN